jgi:hypothetical protein
MSRFIDTEFPASRRSLYFTGERFCGVCPRHFAQNYDDNSAARGRRLDQDVEATERDHTETVPPVRRRHVSRRRATRRVG